jgi:hypothetical protein
LPQSVHARMRPEADTGVQDTQGPPRDFLHDCAGGTSGFAAESRRDGSLFPVSSVVENFAGPGNPFLRQSFPRAFQAGSSNRKSLEKAEDACLPVRDAGGVLRGVGWNRAFLYGRTAMLKNLVAFIAIVIGVWLVREGIDMLNPARMLYVSTVGVVFFLTGFARILFVSLRRKSDKDLMNV